MNKKEIFKRLQDYLSSKRLKSTKQRDAIVEAFIDFKGGHVTIENLLEKVRESKPSIGYATVYRTLMLLVDAGIAHQRHFQEGQSLFELDTEDHHDHLICENCGVIKEFENEMIERLQLDVAKSFGFKLTGHKMELYGICKICQKKK